MVAIALRCDAKVDGVIGNGEYTTRRDELNNKNNITWCGSVVSGNNEISEAIG